MRRFGKTIYGNDVEKESVTGIKGITFHAEDTGKTYISDGGTFTDITLQALGGNVTKEGTTADNEIGVWVAGGNIEGDPNFLWVGSEQTLNLKEVASGGLGFTSYGKIWVKNTTPNELWFTDDGGTSFNLVGAPLTAYTVGTLPGSPSTGDTAYVTDATAPTYLGALSGEGAVTCPVFYNGTAWVSH